MAITGRTALLAALGALIVGLLIPGWPGIVAVEGALLVGVLTDVALAASVRGLQLSRSGDTVVRFGETATVMVTITHPGRRPLRAKLRDAWPPSSWRPGTELEASRHQLTVPPGERRRLTTTLQPTRRGDHHAHRVTIRSTGPLGLAARQGSHTVPWVVRVLPPFTSRKHLPSKLARLRELDGRSSALIRGQGTEFDSLREYIPGDDTRSIDWRATARRSTVAVRTWRPERDRHILLVLDTGRTSAGRVGDAPRLDAALDAALLLATLASRAGDRVDMLAYDRGVRASVQGHSARELLPSLVNAMSGLEPHLVEMDARGLVATVLQQAPQRSLVVLVTGLDTAPVEEGLLPVLSQLTHRHQVVIASVADPRLAEMAESRGTVNAVYEAAAAEQVRAERRRVSQCLARHGVTVVDALPGELPSALADAYLGLKASGRL